MILIYFCGCLIGTGNNIHMVVVAVDVENEPVDEDELQLNDKPNSKPT